MRTTGELVEALIMLKDNNSLTRAEIESINDACNVIESFPSMTEVEEAKTFIRTHRQEMESKDV